MYMNLFDSHVHSDNSHDGEHSITFLCENAVQKNLMGLCITDHYELDLNTEQADLCLRNSFIETGKARQAFDYRLLVMNGSKLAMDAPPAQVFTHAEELTQMGLNIPQVTQVFLELKKLGLDVKNVYTIDQAAAEIRRLKEGNSHA